MDQISIVAPPLHTHTKTKTELAVEERMLEYSHGTAFLSETDLSSSRKRLRYCYLTNAGGLSAGLCSSENRQHSSSLACVCSNSESPFNPEVINELWTCFP